MNEGGLGLLYRIIVDSAAPEIGCVLRLVLEGLEAQRPVLVFCKVGDACTVGHESGCGREVGVAAACWFWGGH